MFYSQRGVEREKVSKMNVDKIQGMAIMKARIIAKLEHLYHYRYDHAGEIIERLTGTPATEDIIGIYRSGLHNIIEIKELIERDFEDMD